MLGRSDQLVIQLQIFAHLDNLSPGLVVGSRAVAFLCHDSSIVACFHVPIATVVPPCLYYDLKTTCFFDLDFSENRRVQKRSGCVGL